MFPPCSPPCSPHVLCYLCVCTCGRSGAARPFIGVLAFSRVKSSEFRQTKHKFPRFWKDVAGAKRVRPALAFTSNADFWKSEKFRLKTERDPCQGMPWALKQAHNVWEIDVTRGAYMSSEHMRSSACLFFFFADRVKRIWVKNAWKVALPYSPGSLEYSRTLVIPVMAHLKSFEKVFN